MSRQEPQAPWAPGRADLARATRYAGACLLAGIPLGLLWWLVTPRPRFRVVEAGVALEQRTAGAFIAADGWFALLGLAAGVVAAVVALARHRRRSEELPGALLGLVLGGALGSLAAWATGSALAPDDVAALAQGREVGESFEGGLRLRAPGVLLVWPVTSALLVFVVLVAEERARRRRAGR